MSQKLTNPEIKAKWIAALRSGKYKQGRGSLCRQRGEDKVYCCLGVLGDILDPSGWIEEHDISINEVYYKLGSTRTALDLAYRNPIGLGNDAQVKLMSLNDGLRPIVAESERVRQHNFLEIADWIEENL